MNQTDWQTIYILFKEQNITKTAEKMYISQPALTYRIKSIEEKLGVQIILRTKQGIKFTRKGAFVAEQAQKMVYQYQQLTDQLQHLGDSDEGLIRMGVSSNFARFMLPSVLKDFLHVYPKVQFNVITSWSKSVLHLAEKGTINLAIIRGDCLWGHEKVLLKQEPICVISKVPIKLSQLPGLPRITFNTDPSLQQTIDQWWLRNFVKPPKVTMKIDSIETCTKMVENGLGYAIVPSVSLTEHNNLEKLFLLDENNKAILRDTWLLYHSSDTEYPVIQKFIAFISDMFTAET